MKFRNVALVANRKKTTLVPEINTVLNLYKKKEYNITAVYTYHEFKCVRDNVRPVGLIIYTKDGNVPEVERSIRTVKERVRCTMASPRFNRIQKTMYRAVVEKEVRDLNRFSARDGIAENISTLSMMTGKHSQTTSILH